MPKLPVMLNLAGKRCVIVGGGTVATRRARAMLDAQADVIIIAPDIDPDLASLPVTYHDRPYQSGDLTGAFLVVIATDDPQVNDRVTRDARAESALVNRTDQPDLGDLTIPAHTHLAPITLAVSTDAVSSTAAAAIRDELAGKLDPDWRTLLTLAGEYRPQIKARHPDPTDRHQALARLADADAMTILKQNGEAALRTHYQSL